MTKVAENFIDVLRYQFHPIDGTIDVWYLANGRSGVSTMSADDFHYYLKCHGPQIGRGATLDAYFEAAPSFRYICRDLERYMFWKVEQNELARIEEEERCSQPYIQYAGDEEMCYMRNYAI